MYIFGIQVFVNIYFGKFNAEFKRIDDKRLLAFRRKAVQHIAALTGVSKT